MEEIKLTNGIRVAMEPLPYLRSFSIGLWVGAGCVHEKNADNGISHFIEHMLFKGTSSRSSREIAACIDALGGNLNAFTAKDCTCFYVNVLSAHYSVAIDLLCDMLLNAALSPEDILREQGVVCEEISMVEDTPDDLAEEKLAQAFYGDHPLGQAILGPAENVRGFSRDTILDYMDKRYVPSNIVISVAGNFEREAVLEMLEEKTAALRADKPVSGITPYEPLSDTVISVQKEIEQINLCLGYPGASRESDAYFAQSMLANIFGGGMSSRLFQRVREQNGMTYAIYSYLSSFTGSGSFVVYAGMNPDQASAVLSLIREEADKLLQSGVSEKELQEAKEQLKGSFVLGLESASAVMRRNGRVLLLDGSVLPPDRMLEKIDLVTMKDMNEQINYVFGKKPCASVVGNLNGCREFIRSLKK